MEPPAKTKRTPSNSRSSRNDLRASRDSARNVLKKPSQKKLPSRNSTRMLSSAQAAQDKKEEAPPLQKEEQDFLKKLAQEVKDKRKAAAKQVKLKRTQ